MDTRSIIEIEQLLTEARVASVTPWRNGLTEDHTFENGIVYALEWVLNKYSANQDENPLS